MLFILQEEGFIVEDSQGAKQIMRDDEQAIWFSKDNEKDTYYLALFNLSDDKRNISVIPEDLDLETFKGYAFEELWTNESYDADEQLFEANILPHGAKLYAMTK